MKTAIVTRRIKAGDVKNLETLERYLIQTMGNCKVCREWNGDLYESTNGDFKVVATIDRVGLNPTPSFILWHKGVVITQANDLKKCFRRFAEARRMENAVINRAIKGIRF